MAAVATNAVGLNQLCWLHSVSEGSAFSKIFKIIEREKQDLTDFKNSEFRSVVFELVDFLILKIFTNIFRRKKLYLNKSQRFSLLLVQFLLIEIIHDFLEEDYGAKKDFQTRFDYSELDYDCRHYFPAYDFLWTFNRKDKALFELASEETQKEIPEFFNFYCETMEFLKSAGEKNFSNIEKAFLSIHEKYADIKNLV